VAVQESLKDPALIQQFRDLGLDIIGNTPRSSQVSSSRMP
jgi:hypothetical protein